MTTTASRRRARADLREVSTAALERLREALAGGQLAAPLTRAGLVGFGVRSHLDALSEALSGHARLACLAILDVALAERAAHDRPAPELVWSGPEARSATARDTAVVLRDLFEGAREHVILAGYSFTHAERLLAPLHEVMSEHGVRATFFVHFKQPRHRVDPPEEYGQEMLAGFLKKHWPFGPPYPALYCDKRALVPGGSGNPDPYINQHAKCVVVDAARALVSSANFTEQAQKYNIEVGVLLADPHFAEHLARQWLSLIAAGHVYEYEHPDDREQA
ncbi:DISARM system phospholipase D-like protein DrmC [Haliangium sp.]|uniref:DISARM system phospholipase D-like protein DrmC n=1 Tax=Haliangium sp. TaxID=2663208 RepID=UPI003D0BCEC8